MAHDGHINHSQQRYGDVRHNAGQGYLQYLTVSDIHIDHKDNEYFTTKDTKYTKFRYFCVLCVLREQKMTTFVVDMMILAIVLTYFAILFGISRLTSRRADNQTFYRANRRAPWYMVAFGMVGASISGVTFVSVPGMVLTSQMTYLQMCLGFIVGYLVIAFVLLPLYYRLNLTSIYTYLGQRLGEHSYLTGASFFLLSKMTGAAVRFYVVCIILQQFVFEPAGIPFIVNVVGLVLLIWL